MKNKKYYLFKSDAIPFYCFKILWATANKKYLPGYRFKDAIYDKICLEFSTWSEAKEFGILEYKKYLKWLKRHKKAK